MAVTPQNLLANFAQGQAIQAQREERAQRREDRERESATRNRLAQMLSGGMPTTPEAQRQVVGAVAQGDPAQALQWAEYFKGQQPDRIKRYQAEAPVFVSQLQGVRDQATYDAAKANLARLGADVSDMPDAYDPMQVNATLQGYRYLAEGPPEAKGGGPFEGTGLQAQAANLLLTADPSSAEYAMAYRIMSQPRTYMDQSSGQIVSVSPDMSGVQPPAGAAGAPPAMAPSGQPRPETPTQPQPEAPEPMNTPKAAGMTVTPIPGSKAAREAKKEAEAKESREAQKKAYARIVTQDIDEVLRIVDDATLPVTGFIGARTAAIPGTAAHDVSNLLDTIKANIGFDRLQQMRAASPSGGALGQVSEMENRLLQATFGALQQSQSEDQFRRNLNRLKDYYGKIIIDGMSPAEIEKAMQGLGGSGEQSAPATAEPEAMDFRNMSDEELRKLAE